MDKEGTIKCIEDVARAVVSGFSDDAKKRWVTRYFGMSWRELEHLPLEQLLTIRSDMEDDAREFYELCDKCHQKSLIKDTLLDNFGCEPKDWRVKIGPTGILEDAIVVNPLPANAISFKKGPFKKFVVRSDDDIGKEEKAAGVADNIF